MTKAATIPHLGMLWDTVLKLRGRSPEFMVADSSHVGADEHGMWIALHYEDCDVLFHRRQGAYRVKGVQMVQKA